MILAPAAMANEPDPKKAAQKCFDEVGLDPDMYRIGHTKASCISRTKWIFFFAFFSVPPLSRRFFFSSTFLDNLDDKIDFISFNPLVDKLDTVSLSFFLSLFLFFSFFLISNLSLGWIATHLTLDTFLQNYRLLVIISITVSNCYLWIVPSPLIRRSMSIHIYVCEYMTRKHRMFISAPPTLFLHSLRKIFVDIRYYTPRCVWPF